METCMHVLSDDEVVVDDHAVLALVPEHLAGAPYGEDADIIDRSHAAYAAAGLPRAPEPCRAASTAWQ